LHESFLRCNIGLFFSSNPSGNDKIERQRAFFDRIPDGSRYSTHRSTHSLSLLLTPFLNPASIFRNRFNGSTCSIWFFVIFRKKLDWEKHLLANYEMVSLHPTEEDQQIAGGYAQPMENSRRGT
jgi:hypothetical protein